MELAIKEALLKHSVDLFGAQIEEKQIQFQKTPPKPKRSAKVTIDDSPSQSPSQVEIDRILDKISEGGYDALTKKEKETLFKASGNK